MKQNADAIIERMLVATRATSLRELAGLLGLANHTPLSAAKTRNTIPKRWLRQLEIRHGINPLWLQTGEGEMMTRHRGAKISSDGAEITTTRPLAGIVESTSGAPVRYPVEYLAPPIIHPWINEQGQVVPNPEAGPGPAIPKIWLQAAGVHLDLLAALDMPSRDMEPEIQERDIVILDRREATPVHGQVYCIAVGSSLLIRRYAGDRAEFVGERQSSHPITAQDATVIGRAVLWVRR